MSVRLRSISEDELEAFHDAACVPFLIDRDPARLERLKHGTELERIRVAEDGGQFVATFGAYTSELSVPGGRLPMAGTTLVSVLPTHRRRGIMRELMTEHLREVHERGEPLAGLWASESSIYGRFGYGPATAMFHGKLEKQYARFQQQPELDGATLRLIEIDEALQLIPGIYRRVSESYPGMVSRSDVWWQHFTLGDQEFMRAGGTRLKIVIVSRAGVPSGYVLYRTNYDSKKNKVSLLVKELIAVTPADEKNLWQYLFDIDLIDEIRHWNIPVDSTVGWWLNKPRMLEQKLSDALWIRTIDVGAALSGRKYSCAGRVTFRFRDELCPWNDGVWQLDVDADGSGRCKNSGSDSPQIEFDPYALGSVYLGGPSVLELSRAGLVQGDPEALRLADRMFAWDRQPWCAEIF